MATQKIITVSDITKNHPITIYQDGTLLRFSQSYEFKDGGGEIIESLGSRDQSIEIEFATLPQAVQDALVGIQNYLYDNALAIEEMT